MSARLDLTAALAALAEERPVFHSEADFQHSLAWVIRERHPGLEVRLEYPVTLDGQRGHVDIWLRGADGERALELKYWTRGGELAVADEQYQLREHGAQPLARYDLWKDVARIERLIKDDWAAGGYMVALTNEHTYWNEGRADTIDATFRTHEGHEVRGSLALSARASAGTTEGRESPIELRGTYVTRWRDYSKPAPGLTGGEFRCLLLDVGAALEAS